MTEKLTGDKAKQIAADLKKKISGAEESPKTKLRDWMEKNEFHQPQSETEFPSDKQDSFDESGTMVKDKFFVKGLLT